MHQRGVRHQRFEPGDRSGSLVRTRRPPAPDSGWSYIFLGVILGVVGTRLLFGDDGEVPMIFAIGLVWLGGVLALVGMLATGVTIGMARYRWVVERDSPAVPYDDQN